MPTCVRGWSSVVRTLFWVAVTTLLIILLHGIFKVCVNRQSLYDTHCVFGRADSARWSTKGNYKPSTTNVGDHMWTCATLNIDSINVIKVVDFSPVLICILLSTSKDNLHKMRLIFLYIGMCVSVTVAQVCNGYAELCDRKWSEISQIGTHDSAFVGDLPAQNQNLDVTAQLDAGVRFLQAQTHYFLNTLTLCHTSCFLLGQFWIQFHFSILAPCFQFL